MPSASGHRAAADLDTLYAGCPPWEIGRPQPAFVQLAQQGELRGRVLDVGCGTGEHALMAAALGLDATGIDLSSTGLQIAERKARERGLAARFLRYDALALTELGEEFDTALDSLFLHALAPENRIAYLDALRAVLRPDGRLFALCYSDSQPPDTGVPHRRSRDEIEHWFADGWSLDALSATRCDSALLPGGVAAWLLTCTRH